MAITTTNRPDNMMGDMASAAASAAQILKRYMAGEKIEPEKIRTATQALATYTKMKAVETSHRSMIYSMLKDLSGSKEELRKLAGLNVPDMLLK